MARVSLWGEGECVGRVSLWGEGVWGGWVCGRWEM